MARYVSRYSGQELDLAIEYFLRNLNGSITHTLDSSQDNPINLNDLIIEEGIYTCQYFVHSADDSDKSPVVVTVVFLDDSNIMQQYELNGNPVRRIYSYSDQTWTPWIPVKRFIQASADETVNVLEKTVVLREVTGDVDELFGDE